MSNTCDHMEYDDYFDKCFDCGMTVEFYTTCGYCREMNIPIIDGDAPEYCSELCELKDKELVS